LVAAIRSLKVYRSLKNYFEGQWVSDGVMHMLRARLRVRARVTFAITFRVRFRLRVS
jgi:hypothetical protein